jgi:hypothetical protein
MLGTSDVVTLPEKVKTICAADAEEQLTKTTVAASNMGLQPE